MASKIILIAAVCVAQGYAFNIFGNGSGRNKFGVRSGNIPLDIEEYLEEVDTGKERNSKVDPDVVIACFKAQRGNYMKLGQKMESLVRRAQKEMAEILKDDYEKYAKKFEEPLKTISKTMRLLPQKMWMHIKDKEFEKAIEAAKEARNITAENSKILGDLLREMSEKHPDAAKKGLEFGKEIRETGKNGGRAIVEAIHKCVKEGGPKRPAEDEE